MPADAGDDPFASTRMTLGEHLDELNRVIEIRPAWTGVRSSMIVEAVRR